MKKMHRRGALVVNSGKVLLPALSAASRLVSEVLYVPLAYESPAAGSLESELEKTRQELWNTYETLQQIKNIYVLASRQCPLLDIRVLLPQSRAPPARSSSSQPFSSGIHSCLDYGNLDVMVSHGKSLEEVRCLPGYSLLDKRLKEESKMEYQSLDDLPGEGCNSDLVKKGGHDKRDNGPDCITHAEVDLYQDIALGGTFDNIHNGHRLMLTQSALLCQRRLVVGVSTGPLVENKVLTELIRPVESRVRAVEAFLRDVKPHLCLEVVPITDIYGPAGTDPRLEALVVSYETAKGGDLINQGRTRKGLKALSVYVVDVIDRSAETSLAQEQKLSSSDIRRNMLGSYREAEMNTCRQRYDASTGPYLIGLTGGIATGKSSIVKRLTALGAYAIDCDKASERDASYLVYKMIKLLGHAAYEPGTKAHSEIVAEFGAAVVGEDGQIDRKVLGPIVFDNKEKLLRLNQIVWPEIWRLTEARIVEAHASGHEVCVVDAAVLLQAGWQDHLHEVWVTIAPIKEVVKRVMDRDGVSEAAAWKRLEAQSSNAERVRYANVVFSSQWEPEYTQKQVLKAWKELHERIAEKKLSSKI